MNSQLIAYYTLTKKEILRFFRIWTQTLLPPVITQFLYLIVFGSLLGSQLSINPEQPYLAFIIPGLILMTIINNSYSNIVSSFFGAKFQRSIEEILVSSTHNFTMISSYLSATVLRGLITGFLVYLISLFFYQTSIYNPALFILTACLTASIFGLLGLINGVFAKKFDDIAIIPTFILTPLTYLGGVFYSIQNLPEFWQKLSAWNPIVYTIDIFRYSYDGTAFYNPMFSLALLVILNGLLLTANLYIFSKGFGLKN